jgi:UDP-glucose 4-epimerase
MALAKKPLTILGDGLQTRDFIYVSDVVEAYLRAAALCKNSTTREKRLYNIGTGKGTCILEVAETLNELADNREKPAFHPERPGDIRFSLGSVDAFRKATGWEPRVALREGLWNTYRWAADHDSSS